MATLDYAFVADFAKVEPNGTLTTVGASWTFLEASVLPTVHRMAVAGRVRTQVGDAPTDIRVTVRGPGGLFELSADGQFSGPAPRPYADGRVGQLFALDLQIPLPEAGLYEVLIDIDGERARRLAFEVAASEDT